MHDLIIQLESMLRPLYTQKQFKNKNKKLEKTQSKLLAINIERFFE